MKKLSLLLVLAVASLLGCRHTPSSSAGKNTGTNAPANAKAIPSVGSIERLDPRLDAVLSTNAVIEKLAEGFRWAEGPVWMKRSGHLVFSDVPSNTVYSWSAKDGIKPFLRPSGYTGKTAHGGESGANGLTLDSQSLLVLCQHGDRQVARLERDGAFTPIARYYKFRKLNSPNDLAFKSNGELYFTDPPYGLQKLNEDPAKELPFNGVYRVNTRGDVFLLTSELSFPNGLAFSPDEKNLYVAVSDPKWPVIVTYTVMSDGNLDNGHVFFDAAPLAAKGLKGLPDGLKVDLAGNVFATGPGGVLIIAPDGTHLGTILTGKATANCAWGEDGSVLYITAGDMLCRVKTKTRGRIL